MGKLFGRKMKAAAPPEEEESPEELETEEEDEGEEENEPVKKKKIQTSLVEPTTPEYREVPVCLSQAQINNIIIENNIMLKQIISEMNAWIQPLKNIPKLQSLPG